MKKFLSDVFDLWLKVPELVGAIVTVLFAVGWFSFLPIYFLYLLIHWVMGIFIH